jgi:hypothetical protein
LETYPTVRYVSSLSAGKDRLETYPTSM